MKTGKLISNTGEQSCTYNLEQKIFEAIIPSGVTSANMPQPLFVEAADGTRHQVSSANARIDDGKIKGWLA